VTWVPFVDISEAQGHVDFHRMHDAGVDHIIIRAHNGTRRDHRIDEYVQGARAASIVVVALYGFINPKSSLTAAQQGQALATECVNHEVSTQMFDVEWYTGEPGRGVILRGQFLASWLRQMSDAAADITQTRGIIYTGHAFWDNPNTGPAVGGFGDHDLILADYPGYRASGDPLPRGVAPADWWHEAFRYKAHGPIVPQGWNGWDGWQFSAGYNAQGPVYGCSSTDLDLNFASAEAVNRWASQSSQPVPVEPPVVLPPTPNPQPAPSAPEEDDDMAKFAGPFFIQATGADGHPPGRVYLCDGRGITLRQIDTPARFDHAMWLLETAGYPHDEVHAPPTPADDVEAYGKVINP
jgi:GH25 family lysozyme M1 (1,4-beta-N-acetylmuramidase)